MSPDTFAPPIENLTSSSPELELSQGLTRYSRVRTSKLPSNPCGKVLSPIITGEILFDFPWVHDTVELEGLSTQERFVKSLLKVEEKK